MTIVPVEKDRYQRTVAEVYVADRKNSAIPLNFQMVRDGYAWHYERYSANCPSGQQFAIAQELAQEEGLGIWNGNPQPPWEFRRKANTLLYFQRITQKEEVMSAKYPEFVAYQQNSSRLLPWIW